MNIKKIILSVGSFCLMGMSIAQIATQNTETVTDIIENTLIGVGTVVTNITTNGPGANAIHPGVQTFTYNGTDFPFSSGVVLRTDNAPSVNLDPDLNALGPTNVTNGVVLEFDFVATGDTMNFSYIFASSEYTGYTCTAFNDVFGFFLSGPGLSGPYTNNAVNIATIPGTTIPVGINTINSGNPANNATCLAANPNYMSDNIYFTTSYNTIMTPMGGGYNGATVALIAASGLICNETYHIKLGIANSADQALNSAVFLEAESFTVFGYDIVVQPSVTGPMTDTLMAEDCVSATLMVVRSEGDSNDSLEICIPVEWEGTLDPYTDLETWLDTICFPAGVDTIYIDFTPIQDNIDEGVEWITITLISVNACGVETPTTVTLYVTDAYEFTYDLSSDPTVQCLTITADALVTNISGSLPPYTYLWSPNGETSSSITMTPGQNTQDTIPYSVTVSDLCGTQVTQNVNLIVNQTLDITPNSGPSACGFSTGFVQFPVTGQTGNVAYELSGLGITNAAGFLTQNVAQNLPSGWYYITATDAVCDAEDSVFVDILDPPVANLTANPMSGFAPLTVTFTNNNENADSHWWDFGNGETLSTTSAANQTITYVEEGPYNVTVCLAALQAGCSDTACLVITVLEFIPPPVLATPNVFSPNGDDINDVWEFITKEFVEKIELVIVNRWGSVVNEQTSATPTWDGKLQDGSEAVDGVYFYKYKATGLDGSTIEGHGSISLYRQ